MAGGDGERRMVFDTSSPRRKGVVKVVYAILALLMGASLFLVTGAGSLADLFTSNGSSTSANVIFEEQATKLERKLKKDPEDEALLGALFRARVNAGNATIVVNSETQQQEVPAESIAQFRQAEEVWSKYLKQAGKEVSPSLAQLAASTFFTAAANQQLGPRSVDELADAAAAQQLVVDAKPTLNSVSTLAYYQLFALEFDDAEKTEKKAIALSKSKSEVEAVEKQLEEVRKRAKSFQKFVKESAKAEQASGQQALENPLGGLGAAGGMSSP